MAIIVVLKKFRGPCGDHYPSLWETIIISLRDLEVDHSCTVELPEGVGSPVDMFCLPEPGNIVYGAVEDVRVHAGAAESLWRVATCILKFILI